eukprot:3941260-Rhodomonas_salina.1
MHITCSHHVLTSRMQLYAILQREHVAHTTCLASRAHITWLISLTSRGAHHVAHITWLTSHASHHVRTSRG